MSISPDQMRAIFPNARDVDAWAPAITAAWQRFKFDSLNTRAGFLGITGNETGGYQSVHLEGMNYSPSRARVTFGNSRANRCIEYCTLDDNRNRVRGDNGAAFGACIYANMLGNGDFGSGDGFTFRGRGVVQLTGRANYRAAGKALGIDLETHPDYLVSDPLISAAAAAWFMADHVKILPLLESNSESDFLLGARRVGNPPDYAATQRRLDYRAAALRVLGGKAPPRVLRKDMTGDDVGEMQQALLRSGLVTEMVVTGTFDDITDRAVRAFQQDRGLVSDGIVGPRTRAALGLA